MTTKRKTITFWIAVNNVGEFGFDADSGEDAASNIDSGPMRVVEVNMTLDLP